jgi:hypothetical protein
MEFGCGTEGASEREMVEESSDDGRDPDGQPADGGSVVEPTPEWHEADHDQRAPHDQVVRP